MKTQGNILITKASGEREAFSETKLRRSLQRVHAPAEVIDDIVAQIESLYLFHFYQIQSPKFDW